MFAVNWLRKWTLCIGLHTNHAAGCEAAVLVSVQTDGMPYFKGELCVSLYPCFIESQVTIESIQASPHVLFHMAVLSHIYKFLFMCI